MNAFDLATSSLALLAAPRGVRARPAARQPAQLLEIYEMENCPYCRVVREVLTSLDIDALIYPCPKQGTRYRDTLMQLGGKAQFPYLVDPNTGTAMYESADIIRYLYQTYADRPAPSHFRIKALNTSSSMLASGFRGKKGLYAKPAADAPPQPLELYSFEASPYARPVRELLCELALPYITRNIGRTQLDDWLLPGMRARLAPDYRPTGRNREKLLALAGTVQSPYLVDPNTDTTMGEAAAIMDYLRREYGK